MIAIKHRFTCATICEFDVKTVKEALALAVSEEIDLSYADLRSADLSYADLHYANLIYADLHYANLSYADLHYANLIYADLHYANLSYADLSSANLSSADLSSADLRSANLRSADLSSADLSYADLRSAYIDGEKITKNPLSITGLYYRCLITDGYMRLGCKRYTHAEWSEFNDSEIEEMDSHATEFWNQWKLPLLAMCKQHAEEA